MSAQGRELNAPLAGSVSDDHRAGLETQLRVLADVRETQEFAPHRARRESSGVARNEGLARGGGLAAVWRQVGVRRHEIDLADRRAKRVGANLRDDRIRALTDIDRALEQREAAVGLEAEPHRRGIRHRGVAATVPHAGDADAALERASSLGVVPFRRGARLDPMGAQGLETRLEAHAVREDLAGHSRLARAKRVEDAELERIDIQAKRELVIELLLRDRALRHAEAAKSAGGHEMRVDRARQRPVVRHAIGAGGVHRHAVGDRRAP